MTLVGAGGCGKSRLATRLAETAGEGMDGGVWWVELGSLADAEAVAHTAMTVLGIGDTRGRTITGALELCEDLQETFQQLAIGHLASLHGLVLGRALLEAGQLDRAGATLDAAEAVAGVVDNPWLLSAARHHRAVLLRRRGNTPAAEDLRARRRGMAVDVDGRCGSRSRAGPRLRHPRPWRAPASEVGLGQPHAHRDRSGPPRGRGSQQS